MDNKVVNKLSIIEKEKKIRKENHREWMRNNDERYNVYYNLINNQ